MDKDTAEGRILEQPIVARYLRIHPTTWYGHICMRVELFGCREGGFSNFFLQVVISNLNPGITCLRPLIIIKLSDNFALKLHG